MIIDSGSFMPKSIATSNEVASEYNRKTEIVNEFEIDADSFTLTFYDNGEIDGDVISVFVNGQMVLSKQKLTANQSRINFSLVAFKTNVIDIVMFAESLGTIPPNTGLLILEYGNQKKEIRFTCDLKKNAGILLKRKKKD